MYSLTFRVRVTTPLQYGQNGTAHAAGEGVFAGMRSACGVERAWRITAALGSAAHFHSVAVAPQPVHRLQIRPVVHN